MARTLRYAPRSLGLLLAVACVSAGNASAALIFTNTHQYAFDGDPDAVEILVEVFDEFEGDTDKQLWKYTVTNRSFDPMPGMTNGFSGFELALPVPVGSIPDLADEFSPAGWETNCCSGLPVEWDIRNSQGPGLLPGESGMFGFTTAPREIAISEGWFHTWTDDFQTYIVDYPLNDGPEVPALPDIVPEPAIPTLGGLALLFQALGRRRRRA